MVYVVFFYKCKTCGLDCCPLCIHLDKKVSLAFRDEDLMLIITSHVLGRKTILGCSYVALLDRSWMILLHL